MSWDGTTSGESFRPGMERLQVSHSVLGWNDSNACCQIPIQDLVLNWTHHLIQCSRLVACTVCVCVCVLAGPGT